MRAPRNFKLSVSVKILFFYRFHLLLVTFFLAALLDRVLLAGVAKMVLDKPLIKRHVEER